MGHTLAIIAVLYENYNVFHDFLKSLRSQEKNFHLFIVDCSVHKKDLDVDVSHTLIHIENNGYAAGVNVGIAAAAEEGYTRFCVMNYDTFFEKGFTTAVLKSLNEHPGSVIGGKILYAPGFEYHKDRYQAKDKGKVIWYAGGRMDWKNAFTPHIGVDELDKGQYDRVQKTEFVTGCLIAYDFTVYQKVGEWNTSYFLYYEDADFCARAAQKKIPLYFDPSITIWHKVSQVTQGSGSSFQQKFQDKNRVIFGLKFAPFRTKLHLLKNFFLEKITKR